MLREFLDADGNSIQQWAMYGTQQNETELEYPYQPFPPPSAWKIWRDALHASYLDKHRDATISPLYRPMAIGTHARPTESMAANYLNDGHDDDGHY